MTTIYITRAGDTWDSIAKTQMGNEYYSDVLLQANFSHAMTAIFSAGVSLTIPEVDNNVTETVNAPPWRQK